MSEIVEGLFETIEEDNPIRKIVNELFDEKNLDRKTELDKPLKWSALTVIEEKLIDLGLKKSALVIANFKKISFRYLISFKRKGREEYVKVLNSITSFQANNETLNEVKPLSTK